MADTDADFQTALETVKDLSTPPDNEVKLQLYGLFKQATVGDVTGKKPGFSDFVGKAKYQAWSQLKGSSADEAKAQYVALVAKLS